MSLKSQIWPAFALLALFTLLTGAAYPLLVTGIAQAVFPHEANGSLVEANGQVVGSRWIGQTFEDPSFFWGRPSATGCNAAASCGSNLGPLNPALANQVAERVKKLREADTSAKGPVPIDLVTTSGSGLDPEISTEAAEYQVPRVARLRGKTEAEVRELIRRHTRDRQWGLFGEPGVNVLELNIELAGMK